MRIALKSIREVAASRPAGYVEDVVGRGVVVGKYVELDDQALAELEYIYRRDDPNGPSFGRMVGNFAGAVSAWARAGFPVVSGEVFDGRLAQCRACTPYWVENARLGLGKCNHSMCGCTKTKAWLATAVCPIGRWSAERLQD